jgi:hypothetical protein
MRSSTATARSRSDERAMPGQRLPVDPMGHVGQTLDPPVISREPGGLFTEDGGPSKSRNQRFGEPPASSSPPRAIRPKYATGPGP